MEDISAKIALKQLIETRGIDILNNGKQCMSILMDMTPGDKDGLENIKIVLEKNLQLLLIDANSKSTTEKQNSIDTMYKRLIGRFNDQTARETCNIFIFALGWNISFKTISPVSPQLHVPTSPTNSIQKKSPIYTQPLQTQYNYSPQTPKKATNIFPKVAIVIICLLVIIAGGITLLSIYDNKNDSNNSLSSSNTDDYSLSTSNIKENSIDNSSNYVQTTDSDEESNISNNNMSNSVLDVESISEIQTSVEKIQI